MTDRQQMIANIEKMLDADDKFRSLTQDDQQDMLENFYNEDCHGNISWDDYVLSNCFLNQFNEGEK